MCFVSSPSEWLYSSESSHHENYKTAVFSGGPKMRIATLKIIVKFCMFMMALTELAEQKI